MLSNFIYEIVFFKVLYKRKVVFNYNAIIDHQSNGSSNIWQQLPFELKIQAATFPYTIINISSIPPKVSIRNISIISFFPYVYKKIPNIT